MKREAEMGSWQLGLTANDDAADFIAELASIPADDLAGRLSAEMRVVAESDSYIEICCMNRALAAATIVAEFSDAGMPIGPVERILIQEHELEVDRTLKDLAERIFTRALMEDNNEWYALWVETTEPAQIAAVLRPYIEALGRSLRSVTVT